MTRIQTTQQTGKFWKLQIMLGALTAIVGGVLMAASGGGSLFGFGLLALIVGIAWFLIARLLAWWFHG